MKFTSAIALTLLPAYTLAVSLGYDDNYGVGSNSLSTVACSDGPNGLMTRGFTTFDSLPTFPHIVSTSDVEGWNSAQCGRCYELTYTNAQGAASSIVVTAVDHAVSGFYTSTQALDELTNGNAVAFGTVDVVATVVDAGRCGL
ncbi:cerato-platanin-like protein [Hymenopellis radicata]|nr:cerato-platanin-like protein [Hymenopellis radicata]